MMVLVLQCKRRFRLHSLMDPSLGACGRGLVAQRPQGSLQPHPLHVRHRAPCRRQAARVKPQRATRTNGFLSTDLVDVLFGQKLQITRRRVPAHQQSSQVSQRSRLSNIQRAAQTYIPAAFRMVSENRDRRWRASHSAISFVVCFVSSNLDA